MDHPRADIHQSISALNFKYTLVSDLHIEHPHNKTPEMEEFIIIAGDTSNGLRGIKYLEKLKRKGHKIFAVDGNHEHYSNVCQDRVIDETEKAFFDHLKQHHVLDLPDEKLRLIGCNGWYHIDDEEHWLGYMSDGRLINASSKKVNQKAEEHALFVKTELESLPVGYKAIVVTHTAPCPESLDPRYFGSAGNGYYWNPLMRPLMYQFREKIKIWHHGHTHHGLDIVVNGVNVVTNPRGYSRENPNWKPLTLEVE